MIGFVVSVLGWITFLVAQGFLVRVAVTLTGDPPPRYLRASSAVVVAALLSLLARIVVGVAGWFIGAWLASVLSLVAMLGLSGLVYSRSFALRPLQGVLVAFIHAGLAAALWWVTGLLT